MTYQLVVQARGDALEDYDLLVAVEDRLILSIDAVGEVDGHDVGSGETNIFILTSDPELAFSRALPILDEFGILDRVRAAYRPIGEDAYTMLWPPNSTEEFEVL